MINQITNRNPFATESTTFKHQATIDIAPNTNLPSPFINITHQAHWIIHVGSDVLLVHLLFHVHSHTRDFISTSTEDSIKVRTFYSKDI